VLRSDFNSQVPKLREEWVKNTGQPWPQVEVIVNGRIEVRNAQAHHIIPVKNSGPTEWWNITPATQTQHTAIHQGPLKELQSGVK
jgi:hypothetical protein